MDSFLKIRKVKSSDDVINLRKLYNDTENCVRNLKSLKVETSTYGCLLNPILKDRLPDELKLFISRKFGHEIWTLDVLLKYIADELLAKESCSSMFKKNNSANNESDKGRYTTSSFALGSHEVTHNIIENVYC